MSTGHDHTHGMAKKTLRLAFFLTMLILAAELIGGYLANSLALFSDAGHVLTDTRGRENLLGVRRRHCHLRGRADRRDPMAGAPRWAVSGLTAFCQWADLLLPEGCHECGGKGGEEV